MILKGKTALVTGSTSGIGLAMAKAMAKQGANVMMNGFGDKEAAIAAVKAYGVAVDYHGADMSKPDEIAQMITATEKRFGSIDVLVNNAGNSQRSLAIETPEIIERKQLEVAILFYFMMSLMSITTSFWVHFMIQM